MSDELEKAFILVVAAILIIFIGSIIGALLGYVVGWVISLTPLAWHIEKGFEAFGFNVEGILASVGATLGFIGSFFKTVNVKNDK